MKMEMNRDTEKNRGNCISQVILFASLFGLFWFSESPPRALMNFVLPWLKKKEEKNRGNSSSIMDDLKLLEEDDLKLVLLPPDIITEILSRLPAHSAIECRGICKQWRSLIDDPSFRDTHTRQVISSSPSNPKKFGNYLIPNSSASSSGFFMYANRYQLEVMEYNDGGSGNGNGNEKSVLWFKPSKVLFEFIDVKWGDGRISSCNGLVFMGSNRPVFLGSSRPNYSNDMFICNPFTREYVNLRNAATLQVTGEERGLGYMTYGFGYHPCTNEYKVVTIHYDGSIASKGKVSVYTLGTGKWRNKGEIPYLVSSSSRLSLFANGAIHWLMSTSTGKQILSFDLADEEFRVVVPLLRPLSLSLNYDDQYGVLGGCLCVTTKGESSINIWVLDVRITNNKEEFSWNKKFRIPWKGAYAKPQVVTKSGKILLSSGRSGCSLVSYDPKTEPFVYGDIFLNCSWDRLISYTKSFVSLKALGEEDVKCWRSVVECGLDF